MYSRRDFSKFAIGATGVISGSSAAFGAIHSKINGVRIGIQTYSFRQMPLDEAIKAMVECGIGECEVFAQHVEAAAGAPSMRPPGPRPAVASDQKAEQKEIGRAHV